MVKHFGYCPSLRKKVDFEVSEVVDIPTKRGIKYQIKGNFEGRLCNTFCSAAKAQELRSQIGSPKVFTVMEAEESQENLAQATQEETVPPIIGPSEKAYGQEGESAQELPLAQTMPTPIISADDMSVQPIDDLSLPDATLADMQETLDVPPTMDANFEIAEIQPEGDGSSIGNIAPMNPDAPLHAEDFDAEESQENLGQATQEESVPAIIGPSQEAYGQEGEAAQELPLAETVPTPIISAVDMNIVSNDSLSSFNGGDILNQMESELGERPEIMADFAIRPYQLFGQGRSIGNIAPMNPDVPFASEDDDDDEADNDDEDDFDAEYDFQNTAIHTVIADNENEALSYIIGADRNDPDQWPDEEWEVVDIREYDAETFDPLTVEEIEVMAQVPPPVCFAEKIPPSVWENTPIQDQLDYASSKNEGLLDCPQCGISKAELRSQGGYCGTTDPESEEYISSRSCPYEKYFAPQHWIDEPQVISHITPERIVLEDTLMAEVDMPAIDPIKAGVETRFIPKGLFYQINSMLPDGVVANQTIDGMSYELSYYGMDTEALDKVLDIQFQGYDMMFGAEYDIQDMGITTIVADNEDEVWNKFTGDKVYSHDSMWEIVDVRDAETFEAESKKKPSKTAEKAILTGASTGATMEIADALLAAEGERSFTLNYGPKRMYVVIEYNDGKELFMQDYKQFVEELNEAEATGDEELIESLFGVGSDYHNIAEEDFDMGGPNSTPYGAEEVNQKKAKKVIETAIKKYDEYVDDKEAYDDEDIISFEEWFDSHLGDDELEGDEETLEYLKTLPRYNSPDSNDWIWKMYHGAETFEADPEYGAETFSYNVAGIEIIVDDANMKHLPSIKATIADNTQNPIGQWKCWDCGETYETSKKPKLLVMTKDKQGAFCGCGKRAETFEAEGFGKRKGYEVVWMHEPNERNWDNQLGGGMESPRPLFSDYKSAVQYCEKAKLKSRAIILEYNLDEDGEWEVVNDKQWSSWGAEEFNVEFDDWADQEMKSHGENVSFKEWAKEEGKKHGDMDLTDWAEEEEMSHDERYGGEEDTFYTIEVGKREGDELIWEGIPLGHKANDKTLAIEEYNEMKSKHDAIRMGEVKNYYEDITSSHGVEGKVLEKQTNTFIMNHNNAENFEAEYMRKGWKIERPFEDYIQATKENPYRSISIIYNEEDYEPYMTYKSKGSGEYYFKTLDEALDWLNGDNEIYEGGKDFRNAETFDVEFDDWAEEEEESHDERYEAESEPLFPGLNCSHCGSDKDTYYGEPETYAPDGKPIDPNWIEAKEHIWCEACGEASPLDERYGAEEYEVLISDNNMDFGDSHNSFNDETEALEEAWKLSQKETDMFVYVRRNDGKVIRVFRPNLGRGAETFESQSAQTKVKPPIKSIGILLGLGAIAAVVAPENLKKMFKR